MDLSDEDYYDDEDYCDGDEDQDDQDDDYQNPPTEKAASSSCKVITKECLLAAQTEDLQRAMDMLSLKEHHARTLLIHYGWDVDKVFDILVNKGKEILYQQACLMIHDDVNITSPNPSSKTLCQICKEEVHEDNMTTMDCSHRFCNICWREHFVAKINEGQSKRIRCMAYECYTICNEATIRTLIRDKNPDLANKFDGFLLESYVEDNKRVKWCPSVPHCGNAIRIDDGDVYREIECTCGFRFCFNCTSEPHSPCSCRMWEIWTKKCKEKSMDITWIKFYYNRFDALRDSNESESTLKERLHDDMEAQEADCDNWLITVVDSFLKSRRILSYSYPFAYYMFVVDELFTSNDKMVIENKGTKKNLFEDQQQQIQAYLEKLSFIFHQEFKIYSKEQFKDLKTEMLTMSSLIDNFCKNLYEFIDNELLHQHQVGTNIHIIAPYRSNGPEKAVKFDH